MWIISTIYLMIMVSQKLLYLQEFLPFKASMNKKIFINNSFKKIFNNNIMLSARILFFRVVMLWLFYEIITLLWINYEIFPISL